MDTCCFFVFSPTLPFLDINITSFHDRIQILMALNTSNSLPNGLAMTSTAASPPESVPSTYVNSMTGQTLEEILALANIHSIADLDEKTVGYLTYVLEGRVPLTPFPVSVGEYFVWRALNADVRDVEYDATIERMVIKATSTELHDTTLLLFEDWVTKWADEINDTEDTDEFRCYSCARADIRGPYDVSEKQADIGLWKVNDQHPLLVVEVGVNESLYEERMRWFEGTAGKTTTVILVEITEENRPTAPLVQETWGLDSIDLCIFSHERLSRHIYEWHKANNIPLVGDKVKFDLRIFRPNPNPGSGHGPRVCDAAVGVYVPNAAHELPPRFRMIQDLSVTLSRDGDNYYNPENPKAYLNFRQLTCRLGMALAKAVPEERARKLAWAFISRRQAGFP